MKVLVVPLYPARGLARVPRVLVLGSHVGPSQHLVNLAIAAGGACMAAAGSLARWEWLVVASVVVGGYVIARALVLPGAQRRQRVFEQDWLKARTDDLRGHRFEVLRLSADDRDYDPARPADVRALLRMPGRTRVTLTFAYPSGDDFVMTEVHRDLDELTFVPGRPSVRFPDARYLAQPEPGRRPARRARWSLDGRILASVSADPAGIVPATGAGTRNSRLPGAGSPAGTPIAGIPSAAAAWTRETPARSASS